jgi:DNA-binding IscR family transcriptional regulator
VRISAKVDYAVRAMAELVTDGEQPVTAESIARAQQVSLKYLLTIFTDLRRSRLVRSVRGPDGGFVLARPATEITLADIFRSVDGALPEVWMAIRASLRRVLEGISLAQLAAGDLPAEVTELADEYRTATQMFRSEGSPGA